jgi:hypothetical protein
MKKMHEYSTDDIRNATASDIQEAVREDPAAAAHQMHSMAIALHNTQYTLNAVRKHQRHNEDLETALRNTQHMLYVMRNQQRHNEEWWKTYRAALTGVCARSGDLYNRASPEGAHIYATASADKAHGPLQPGE